jgi:hypothetical protein
VKKLITSITLLIAGAISISSCNKCITCEYSYKRDLKDTTIVRPQVCGNSKELENEELAAQSASAKNFAPDYSCIKE